MLEGGCGPGYYRVCNGTRGIHPVGVDFAVNPLRRLRKRDTALPLCAGDVGALPFGDQAFDVYRSGGVVEHFEAGCEGALRECRPVLRSDGVRLISVPYFSPQRRVLSWLRSEGRALSGPQKHAYTPGEFRRMIEAAGLRVRAAIPYSILWGLFEVSGLRALAGRLTGSGTGPARAGAGAMP